MKGKEAAAAARRRVEALEAQIATTEAKNRSQLAVAVEDSQKLRLKIEELSSALEGEVRRMSADRVAEDEDRVTQRWHAERDIQQKRLEDSIKYITGSAHFRFQRGALTHLAEISSLPLSKLLLSAETANRNVRRARSSDMNYRDSYGPRHIPILPDAGMIDDDVL